MQKNKQFALRVSGSAAIVSAFGFLARWAQNMSIFDENTGLAVSGAVTSWIVVLFSIGVTIGLGMLLLPTLSLGAGKNPAADIRSGSSVYRAVCTVSGAAICISGAIIFIQAVSVLYKVLATLAIICGISIAATGKAGQAHASDSLAAFFTAAPVLFCCFWLIVSYKEHAANPVVWQYAIEVLAIAMSCVALYFIAGFVFCRPRLFPTALTGCMGAYLCFMCLGDSRRIEYQLIFAALGAFFLITVYFLLANQEPENKKFSHLKEE